GTSTQIGLTVAGEAVQISPNELSWTFTLTRSGGGGAKEWGGISFKLALDPLASNDFKPSPKLLHDNVGWELQFDADKPPLQITFSPRPASVTFERGNVGEIRVYFNEPEQPLPSEPITMRVSLPPGGVIGPSLEE